MLYGEGLALTSALLWGMMPILVRKGLSHSTASVGVMLGLLASAPLIILVFSFHSQSVVQAVAPQAVAWFVAVGILGPCLGRVFNYLGVARLGAAKATPLISTSPLFTTVLALMFLREQITLKVLLGVLCIVTGIATLTGQQRT
jgi:drug/metabolite transporter (DMT)-like permease